MRVIDRFCYKHPRFGIPNLMLFVAVGNAVVLLFGLMDTTGKLVNYLSFDPMLIFTQGQVWRLLTFLLVPENNGNIIFTAITVYLYYFIGSTLERQWGTPKFNFYYISGVIFTIIYGVAVWLISGWNVSVSTMYINLSMFFSFATLWPDMRLLLFFIIPVKIKWLALVNAVFFVIGIIVEPFPLNLLPIVAILNYLMFCGGDLWRVFQPYKARNSGNAVNFRRAARKVKQQQKNAAYTRKCAVCGRTDTDHPELTFRYCSRCAGYHCFCEDHIGNHVHFTE